MVMSCTRGRRLAFRSSSNRQKSPNESSSTFSLSAMSLLSGSLYHFSPLGYESRNVIDRYNSGAARGPNDFDAAHTFLMSFREGS